MQGIKFIIGIHKGIGPKGGKTTIQSVLIPKRNFSKNLAKLWLKGHGFLYNFIDESENFWRSRQHNPEEFMRLRTIGAGSYAGYITKKHNPTQSSDIDHYAVVLRGGSLGETSRGSFIRGMKVIKTYAIKAEASLDAKERNKHLSKGEKSYYKMKYLVVPLRKNPKDKDDLINDFIKKYGVAQGGDWGRMLMSAIRNGMPEVHAKLSKTKSFSPIEMWAIIDANLHNIKRNPSRDYHKGRIVLLSDTIKSGRLIAAMESANEGAYTGKMYHGRRYLKLSHDYNKSIVKDKSLEGQIQEHKESMGLSENPQAKTYVGITFQAKPRLFTSSGKPTQAKFGKEFIQIHGPFKSYTDAERFEDRLRVKHKMNPVMGKLSSKESNVFQVAYSHGAKEIKEGINYVRAIFTNKLKAQWFGEFLSNHKFDYKIYQNKLGKFVVSFREV